METKIIYETIEVNANGEYALLELTQEQIDYARARFAEVKND